MKWVCLFVNSFSQLQKLNDVMKRAGEGSHNIDGESDNEKQPTKREGEGEVGVGKPSLSGDKTEHEGVGGGGGVLSDDDSCIKAVDYFRVEEDTASLVNMVEPADGSLSTSHEDWGSLNSDCLFDESRSSLQWWDFWS